MGQLYNIILHAIMLLYHICCSYLNNKVLHWVLISVDKRWTE